MKNNDLLIEKIRKCNLSSNEKQELIAILTNEEVDLNELVLVFLRMLKLGEIILEFGGIDIENLIK
jgi:hypothetical protein